MLLRNNLNHACTRNPVHRKWILRAHCVLFALLVPFVAHGQQKVQYIAATQQTVRMGVDSITGASTIRQIWIDNGSSVPIRIVKVTLIDCVNTQACDDIKTNVTVAAGERRTVYTIRPKVRNERSWFRQYSIQWYEDSTSAIFRKFVREAGLQAPTQQVDPAQAEYDARERAQQRAALGGDKGTIEQQLAQLTARRRAEALARGETLSVSVPVQRDTEPSISPEDMAQLGDKILTWRAEPDTLILKMGDKLLLEKLRIVAIGADGKQLGRIRGSYKFGFGDNIITIAPPDTLVPVTRGRSALFVAPGDALNKGRTKPFPQLKFTIIVP